MRNLVFLFVLIGFCGFSQVSPKSYYHWNFGENNHLDFNDDDIEVLSDSSMNSEKGVSTYSNGLGELLLYTNGETVWNSNNEVLINGTNLGGNKENPISSIIVPTNKICEQYYIFSTDTESNGLTYSIVDLASNTVIEKNTQLLDQAIDKIAISYAFYGVDSYWVIAHGTDNKIYIFYFDENGINTTPTIQELSMPNDENVLQGSMKLSRYQNLLAIATKNFIEIFNFDNKTGELTHHKSFLNRYSLNGFNKGFYGLEFFNYGLGDYLYYSSINETEINHSSIYRIDATSDRTVPIKIYESFNEQIGELMLTPDKSKIIAAVNDKEYLHVINNPISSDIELIDFHEKGILLENKSNLGLNTRIYCHIYDVKVNDPKCHNYIRTFTIASNKELKNILWNFGDGNTSNEQFYIHTYEEGGTYNVTVEFIYNGELIQENFNIEVILDNFNNPVIASSIPNQFLNSCENQTSIELTQFISSVMGSQDASLYEVFFYNNPDDLKNGINPIFNYTYNEDITYNYIYYSIRKIINPKCYTSSYFSLINDIPIASDHSDNTCTNSEISLSNYSDILSYNEESFLNYDVLYFNSENDALYNINQILNDIQTINNTTEYFIRVQSQNFANCFDVSKLLIEPIGNISVNEVSDYYLCEEEEYTLNLFNIFTTQLIGSQNPNLFTINYYLTIDDAENQTNPLNAIETFTSNEIELFARIDSNETAICYDIKSFKIYRTLKPHINIPFDGFETCDDESNDGIGSFELGLFDSQILDSQNASEFSITYHETEYDATLNINALNKISYTNIVQSEQEIFIRIENNTNTNCYTIDSFSIYVREKPEIIMDDSYIICTNFTKEIIAPNGFDYYEWSDGQIGQYAVFNSPGNYSLTAYYNYENIDCSSTFSLIINESNSAIINSVEINDWSRNENSISIIATGIGDYEFALKDEDLNMTSFQDSPHFTNLKPGDYKIIVRDKNGCGDTYETTHLLYYPYFFTPNNDGVNDYWNLFSSDSDSTLVIYIYDKYGKFLKQIDPMDKGWNGKFNNVDLPSDDYWFRVNRSFNGKTYRGHFSLKR